MSGAEYSLLAEEKRMAKKKKKSTATLRFETTAAGGFVTALFKHVLIDAVMRLIGFC
jgi:hypothetical protein